MKSNRVPMGKGRALHVKIAMINYFARAFPRIKITHALTCRINVGLKNEFRVAVQNVCLTGNEMCLL